MAVLYLNAATEKIYKLDLWQDGTALYYWFNDSVFGMSPWLSTIISPILDIPFLLTLLTWGVFVFELVLAGAFFMDSQKKRNMLKYALFFHFMIIIVHGLVSFFFAMAGGLVLYLIEKDKELKFEKIRRLLLIIRTLMSKRTST